MHGRAAGRASARLPCIERLDAIAANRTRGGRGPCCEEGLFQRRATTSTAGLVKAGNCGGMQVWTNGTLLATAQSRHQAIISAQAARAPLSGLACTQRYAQPGPRASAATASSGGGMQRRSASACAVEAACLSRGPAGQHGAGYGSVFVVCFRLNPCHRHRRQPNGAAAGPPPAAGTSAAS